MQFFVLITGLNYYWNSVVENKYILKMQFTSYFQSCRSNLANIISGKKKRPNKDKSLGIANMTSFYFCWLKKNNKFSSSFIQQYKKILLAMDTKLTCHGSNI